MYTVSSNEDNKINLEAQGIEEILQNVRMILGTIEGEVPLDRRFGLSGNIIDSPTNRIDKLNQEVFEKVEMYEPRVKVTSINAESDNLSGKVSIVVGVKINEDYI